MDALRTALSSAVLCALLAGCGSSVLGGPPGDDGGTDIGPWVWPGPTGGDANFDGDALAPWWNTDANVGGSPVVEDAGPGAGDGGTDGAGPGGPDGAGPGAGDDAGGDGAVELPPAPPCSTSGDTCPLSRNCPDLAGNIMRPVSFFGARSNVPISCGGAGAPDVVIPLTLGARGDVDIVVTPTGSSQVHVAIFAAPDCAPATEVRCGAGQGGGVPARVRAVDLPAGRYYVVIKSTSGNPAFVSTAYEPSRPYPDGDRCPGVVERPDDGAFTTVTATHPPYGTHPDHGTSCGSGAVVQGSVDVVFQYTLAAARDVTLDVRATTGTVLSAELTTTCGARPTVVDRCVSGGANAITRNIRRQPAGTYYVVVEYRHPDGLMPGMPPPGRSVTLEVNTRPATELPAADRCPGAVLFEGVPSVVRTALLERDLPWACFGGDGWVDAVWSFPGPSAGRDVVTAVRRVNSTRGGLFMMQPRAACPGVAGPSCTEFTSRQGATLVQRRQGLGAGGTHFLSALAQVLAEPDAALEATYWTVVPAVPVTTASFEHNACASPAIPTFPPEGGIFQGDLTTASHEFTPPPGCACVAGGRDAVYRLELTERRRVLLSLSAAAGASWNPLLYVLRGSACETATSATPTCVGDVVGTRDVVDATLDPGTYWVVVDTCTGTSGRYVLDGVIVPPGA